MQALVEPAADPSRSAGPTASPGAPSPTAPRWGAELSGMVLVLAALASVAYRIWERAWTTPFVHGGDAMAHLALLETVGITGTPGPNDVLGAPHGVDWVDMPSGADRAHLVVLRVLRALTGDTVVAANVYLLLAVVATGLAAYVVVRRMSCSAMASGVAAAVFAIAPAQFARAGVGHLFLANYVAVPIAVWLAVWASEGFGPSKRGWRSWAVPAVLVVVLGSSSAYYAAFGAIAIAGVGVVRALRHGAWRPSWRPLVTAAATVVVVAANVAGEVARRGGDAGVRVPLDSDSFGLRVAQMVLPVRDHRIGVLADWADRAHRVAAPGDRGAALGLLALVGLVAVVVWCIRRVGSPLPSSDLLSGGVPGRDGVLARLGVLALVVVAFASVGGLGMVLATVGVTQVRAWSRMAILVGFVGVAGLAMLLDGVARRRHPTPVVRVLGAVALVGFALIDQLGTSVLPPPSFNEGRWGTDRELAADLQAALPDGATVFQLPVGTYPAELPLGAISANDLLGPAVAADGSLRWTVGALNGRGGDWQRTVAALRTGQMVEELAAADVAALAVDRRGFADDGAEQLEVELSELLGAPAFVSSDGTRAWYDLRPVRARLVAVDDEAALARRGARVTRPVGVVVEGSPGVRSTRDARARHLGPRSTIVLTDESANPAGPRAEPLAVAFSLTGEPGAQVELQLSDGGRRTVVLGDDPVAVDLVVQPGSDGTARIELRTDAPPLPAPVDDWGDLRLRLDDLMVRDARLEG